MTITAEKSWGNKGHTPMLLTDEEDNIIWCNHWVKLLFGIEEGLDHLLQLPAGRVLSNYALQARKGSGPYLFSLARDGLSMDVETEMREQETIAFKFHPVSMEWNSMLEMHRFMQDFALESGDRLNNPLTTVLNCLRFIKENAERGDTTGIPQYAEMAIRGAFSMKEFCDRILSLSEEGPCSGSFDLADTLREIMIQRECEDSLEIQGKLPLVRGCPDHARRVLSGLVNLGCQAGKEGICSVKVWSRYRRLAVVGIYPKGAQTRDLRTLTEEFYEGLGFLAARYLLSLMQAQVITDYLGDAGIRVTFVAADAKAENTCISYPSLSRAGEC